MCKKKPFYILKSLTISLGVTILILVSGLNVLGQEVKIELGKKEVALNEAFTITIIVEGDRIRNYDEFPDIPGFTKQAKSTSSSTNIINGKVSSSHRITQNYQPNIEGTYTIPPFEMAINGQIYSSSGARITVLPPKQGSQFDPFARDPFEEFFGRSQEPQEFIDVKADVFFALTTDKNEVYVGEGFVAILAYYEAENNPAQMQFHDLNRQINEILKKIKQVNCWEENFEITNIVGVPVEINGKRYRQYKLYQAALYPLNSENIVFPAIGLNMVKYQVAKTPSFFGQSRRGEIIELVSDKKIVSVKELPPHPLRNRVAVGDYHLKESINSRNLETGISFNYEFNIVGEGNISAINNPTTNGKDVFDFYPPNIRQNINRSSNQISGSKSFTYFGIPKEPGSYNLGDYVQWTFFNPKKHRYETLRSRLTVEVTGESRKNQSISSADLGSFYDIIELENNVLTSRINNGLTKTFANIIIFLMLALTLFILIRK
jgi:hypothetical protein